MENNNQKSRKSMQEKMMEMCANMDMDECRNMMQNMMGARMDFGSMRADSTNEIVGTPELQSLFFEWCNQIKEEMREYSSTQQNASLEELSAHFKLSLESCDYIMNKLK